MVLMKMAKAILHMTVEKSRINKSWPGFYNSRNLTYCVFKYGRNIQKLLSSINIHKLKYNKLSKSAK